MLTQQEADALLALEKHYLDKERFTFPSPQDKLSIPVYSIDKREKFILDITRSGALLTKNTFQTRARKVIPLVRLDIIGAPHRNPDGEEIACPHLHLYKEGYADQFAISMPDIFGDVADTGNLLNKFMEYCKIVGKPPIDPGLFP